MTPFEMMLALCVFVVVFAPFFVLSLRYATREGVKVGFMHGARAGWEMAKEGHDLEYVKRCVEIVTGKEVVEREETK